MPVSPHKGIILHVELPADSLNTRLFSIIFFGVQQFAQAVPNLNHGGQPLPRPVIFNRQRGIAGITKTPSHLEDDFAALWLHAIRAHFQGLEILRGNEVFITLFAGQIFYYFSARRILHGREHTQTLPNFLPKVEIRR